MARKPMTSRSASGEGESRNADMIHCSFGMTTRRARIAVPNSQFTTMRMRSTTYAIGSAADDEAGLDMIHTTFYISNINKLFIEYRQSNILKFDKTSKSRAPSSAFADRLLVAWS